MNQPNHTTDDEKKTPEEILESALEKADGQKEVWKYYFPRYEIIVAAMHEYAEQEKESMFTREQVVQFVTDIHENSDLHGFDSVEDWLNSKQKDK